MRRHTYTRTNGSEVYKGEIETTVYLPEGRSGDSPIKISDDGIEASMSGNFAPPERDDAIEGANETGGYLTIIFAVAAVALLIARFWFPIIPLVAPLACGGASIMFFMLPTLLDRYSKEIMWVGGGVTLWVLYEAWHQRKLQTSEPPPTDQGILSRFRLKKDTGKDEQRRQR
jgi:hypothetical protein